MSDRLTIEIVGAFESLTPEYLEAGDGGEVLVEAGQWIVTAIADEKPVLGHHEIGGGTVAKFTQARPTEAGLYWVWAHDWGQREAVLFRLRSDRTYLGGVQVGEEVLVWEPGWAGGSLHPHESWWYCPLPYCNHPGRPEASL